MLVIMIRGPHDLGGEPF